MSKTLYTSSHQSKWAKLYSVLKDHGEIFV